MKKPHRTAPERAGARPATDARRIGVRRVKRGTPAESVRVRVVVEVVHGRFTLGRAQRTVALMELIPDSPLDPPSAHLVIQLLNEAQSQISERLDDLLAKSQ